MPDTPEKRLTPLQAIHEHCLWCAGSPDTPEDVESCKNAKFCALHPYRTGHRPPKGA